MKITAIVQNLHPEMRQPALHMAIWLAARPFEISGSGMHVFWPFEGYRAPARQETLYAKGNVTYARAWQSAHQYGLAVDFAVLEALSDGTPSLGTWSWPEEAPWEMIETGAEHFGLSRPITWDKGHVVHPAFAEIRDTWSQ